ncbi:glutaredoxin family protein [Fervidibacillus halotolerans]|uniref:Glutaredoxin family protein n=1 Tax=Fervidibacillus halotolerans TaxID=2980027 RepID=A0A9E8LYJ4_9BACI|nr:glutaredoxin family protein [Fervidibacillus halotolerans]WAA11944.1 glutaredoxin family protein [Fervidibacillus halotolerans]
MKQIIVYSRKNCHLCHEAESILKELEGELPITWEKRDIDEDDRLIELYDWYVPVIELEGRILQSGKIVKEMLKKQLMVEIG